MDEFDLIDRYFDTNQELPDGVTLGIGDDAAVLRLDAGKELVVTTDSMVAGVHFSDSADPSSIGHKLAAVNLSDIAAMGASPRWALLTLTLPSVNEAWLREFSGGLLGMLERYHVELVGGDTTRGATMAGLTVIGTVPMGKALKRSGAVPGELVCVSGQIGDAALALAIEQGLVTDTLGNPETLRQRLIRPEPRVELGLVLRERVSSCIDISDGLAADAGHIAAASNCGMTIDIDALPLSGLYQDYLYGGGVRDLAVAGGDDYELCFTVNKSVFPEIVDAAKSIDIPVTVIGEVIEGEGISFVDGSGAEVCIGASGYRHFDGGEV